MGPRPDACYDGTREGILQQITDWMAEPSERNILWISGAPGVGKSAISSSVVSHLETNQTNPFAVFFIKRQGNRDPRIIWRTVAFQLALSFQDYRSHLLKMIHEGTKNGGVKQQFTDLISNPFNTIYQHTPPDITAVIATVVIDALDECLLETEHDVVELLDTIAEWNILPPSCKLIVFSRPESVIVRQLKAEGVSEQIVLPSGLDVDSEAARDIRTYLLAEFSKISRVHGIKDEPWPTVDEVDQLVAYATGLFIFAATVVRFVGGLKGDPQGRLQDVLENMQHWNDSSEAFDPIRASTLR